MGTEHCFSGCRDAALRLFAGVCVAVAIGTGFGSRAQQPPSSADPGLLERRFERAPVPTAQPLPRGAPTPWFAMPAPSRAGAFVLGGIVVEGATLFAPALLEQLGQHLVGTSVTLADLRDFADTLTAVYRNAGWVLSRVVVPEQRVVDGVVRLQVIEGYVNEARADGIDPLPDYAHGMLARIVAERPLRNLTLERYSLLLDDQPGLSARAVLAPATDPAAVGGSDLSMLLEEKRWDASLHVDNRGTRYSGPVQVQAGGGLNSLFRRFDRTQARVVLSANDIDHMQVVTLDHEQPLGSEGTRLRLSGMLSWQEPDYLMATLDSESESNRLTAELRHPFIRSRHRNLTGRVLFTAFNIETEQLGWIVSRENLRSLRLGLSLDWADAWRGTNLVDVEFSQGLNLFGARRTGSANLSRQDGRSDYTKVALFASRDQALTHYLSVNLRAMGQYAFNELLASEEFGYGGGQLGRAHDSSELTGDHGLAGGCELRWTQPGAWRFLSTWQAYAYAEAGGVWREDRTNRRANETATDAGAGLRLNFDDRRQATIELSKPLRHGVASQGTDGGYGWRVFFSVTANF
jgi:hemolysin activation/secretion protein